MRKIIYSLVLIFTLSACDRKPETTMGEQSIDQTVSATVYVDVVVNSEGKVLSAVLSENQPYRSGQQLALNRALMMEFDLTGLVFQNDKASISRVPITLSFNTP